MRRNLSSSQCAFLFGVILFIIGILWNLAAGIEHRGLLRLGESGAATWQFSSPAMIFTATGLMICLLALMWAVMDRWRKGGG